MCLPRHCSSESSVRTIFEPQAIVVNLEHIKAIITVDYVLVVNHEEASTVKVGKVSNVESRRVRNL